MRGKQNFTQPFWNDWKIVEAEHRHDLRKMVCVLYPEKKNPCIQDHQSSFPPHFPPIHRLTNFLEIVRFFKVMEKKIGTSCQTLSRKQFEILHTLFIRFHNSNLKNSTNITTCCHCVINFQCLRRPPFSVEVSCHPIETWSCKDINSGTIFTLSQLGSCKPAKWKLAKPKALRMEIDLLHLVGVFSTCFLRHLFPRWRISWILQLPDPEWCHVKFTNPRSNQSMKYTWILYDN